MSAGLLAVKKVPVPPRLPPAPMSYARESREHPRFSATLLGHGLAMRCTAGSQVGVLHGGVRLPLRRRREARESHVPPESPINNGPLCPMEEERVLRIIACCAEMVIPGKLQRLPGFLLAGGRLSCGYASLLATEAKHCSGGVAPRREEHAPNPLSQREASMTQLCNRMRPTDGNFS